LLVEKAKKEDAYIIVYSVATEFCVKATVLGFLERGLDVYIVEDAIKGVDKNNSNSDLKLMK